MQQWRYQQIYYGKVDYFHQDMHAFKVSDIEGLRNKIKRSEICRWHVNILRTLILCSFEFGFRP